jgi:hypothetical protein
VQFTLKPQQGSRSESMAQQLKVGGHVLLSPSNLSHHQQHLSNTTMRKGNTVKKKKQARVPTAVRRSSRQNVSTATKQAKLNSVDNGILHIDKVRDGHEEQRKKESLQAKVKIEGPMAFEALPKGKALDSVNEQRRKSRNGILPCYDIMDGEGASIYAYSLPLTVMAGLLQGLKSEDSLKTFRRETSTLFTHHETNYMFLHWTGEEETTSHGKDFRNHEFCLSRPGLVTCFESLGRMIADKILFNPKIGATLYPGMLSNQGIKTDVDQDFQMPHWDFIGWRHIKAEDMPWVVHVPLCKEGMMLHVWPTKRDEATHTEDEEKFKLGIPKLVFVAFGDYLLLRADVCHGGCFGTKGNMRLHMVLRREGCPLGVLHLDMLEDSGVDKSDFQQKKRGLASLLGKRHVYFQEKQQSKGKTVTAYVSALTKNIYPCHDTWAKGLLENLNYDKE